VNCSFRLAGRADFEALWEIERACFEPPFRFERGYLRSLLAQKNSQSWIAEADGQPAGFAVVEWERHECDGFLAYIPTLEVLPAWRGRGWGRELLARLEESARGIQAEQIWLNVDAENMGAIRLYESSGYVRQGRQENYYPEGRAALVYCKLLAVSSDCV
jgi:ribosomal protein S18 acetylase RimI-like enzyme